MEGREGWPLPGWAGVRGPPVEVLLESQGEGQFRQDGGGTGLPAARPLVRNNPPPRISLRQPYLFWIWGAASSLLLLRS